MNNDIFCGYGVEVIVEEENFLKIAETLTRIGIYSRKNNALYQSVHILHRRGRYVLIHFKELFGLDGKDTDISDNDLERRNTIAKLLQDWELLVVKHPEEITDIIPISQLKILSYKDKDSCELVSKYSIGKTKQDHARNS